MSTDSASSIISPAQSWQGSLALAFERRGSKTILSRSQVQAPLKIQRSFYPEGDRVCHSVMLHTAGGIVGGDRLAIEAQLGAETQVLLTTAAATKVYRSNGALAQQMTQIRVAQGADLEWFPQETILFDGAIYQQQLKVELASEASWISWDITRLGRSARGEQFTCGQWRSRTEIWQNDRLIWIDPQVIHGGSETMTSAHGLATYPVIGSFVMIGRSVSDDLMTQLRSIDLSPVANSLLVSERLIQPHQNQSDPIRKAPVPPHHQIGMTRLTTGLLCRYRGHSSAEARHWFIALWQLLRQAHRGQSACLPRVWQL